MLHLYKIMTAAFFTTAILTVNTIALADSAIDISSINSAMEYLLEQNPDSNVEVSFRVNRVVESTEELISVGEQISDEIAVILHETGKDSYQSSQYPYSDGGICMNYWYDENLTSCIGFLLGIEDDGLNVSLFLQSYQEITVDWCELPFGLSFGSDSQEIEEAIQYFPYYIHEVFPGTIYEESTYLVLTPGSDQVEYIQINDSSYFLMQNMKIQAENDVIIPVSHYMYKTVYFIDDAEDISAKKVEVADELAQKWNGNWTNGYRKGNWLYSVATEDYLEGDPLLETEFWEQWGKIFSSYCSVSVGDSLVGGHAIVTHIGKGIMPVELLKEWNVY